MELHKNRIVIKVGTSTLTNESGSNDLLSFDKLSRVISDIHNRGHEVILVSSGAIAVGRNRLHMRSEPDSLRLKQAAAAVGQCSIMFLYDKFLGEYDKIAAQILLNADDVDNEAKKQNLLNTFDTLLEMGVIPVVNENDSVSYSEIESSERLFGDNDMLSAVVAVLCGAAKLVILSDIDGLFEHDPRSCPEAKLIPLVDHIDKNLYDLAGGAGSRRGTGGMRTKLQAAELATSQGIETVITNGHRPRAIYDIVEGRDVGTRFKARFSGK